MLKFLLVVIVFALLTYGLVRAIQRRGVLPAPTRKPTRKPAPKAAPKMLAPDDDPDFLRDLDRKRRQAGDADSGG